MFKKVNFLKNIFIGIGVLTTVTVSLFALDVLAFNSYFLNLKSIPIIKTYFKSRSVSDCQFKATNMENNIKGKDAEYTVKANDILLWREKVLKNYQALDQTTFDARMTKYDELTNNFDKNLETMFDNGTQALAMKEDVECDLKKFNDLYMKFTKNTPDNCYNQINSFANGSWFYLDERGYQGVLSNSLNTCRII